MRVDGADFFSSLTFPVGSLDKSVTYVTGGWGGWVTGITSVDHMFANENVTTGSTSLKMDAEYPFYPSGNTGRHPLSYRWQRAVQNEYGTAHPGNASQ